MKKKKKKDQNGGSNHISFPFLVNISTVASTKGDMTSPAGPDSSSSHSDCIGSHHKK